MAGDEIAPRISVEFVLSKIDSLPTYCCGGGVWLDEDELTSGASRRVMWMLAWVSGTVPSLACTSVGLPWMRRRWTVLPRAGMRTRWVTEAVAERTVTGTSAAA